MFTTVLLAQEGDGGAGLFGGLLPLIIIGLLFYFLLIRPQQRRAKNQRELVNSLEVGDMIVTIGGFHGIIQSVDESTVRLELNPTNVVTLSKQAVARRTVDADTESDESSGEL